MPFHLFAASVIGAVVAAADAAPEMPSAQLVYTADTSVTGCPTERELRDAVSARLGYSPFVADASKRVSVRLARAGRGLEAVVLAHDGGRVVGSRTLSSPRNDCSELASAMTLAISIAIDPFVLTRGAPSPAPSTSRASSAPPDVQSRPESLTLLAAVGGQVAVGAAPGPVSGGVMLRGGLRRRAASLSIEGRLDPQVDTAASPTGRVGATLLLAELVPCVHHRWLAGCALAGAGALRGLSFDVAEPRRQTTFYAVAGGRLAAAIPLVGAFALDIHLDGLAVLTRTSLDLDGQAVWTTPPLSVAIGSAVLASF